MSFAKRLSLVIVTLILSDVAIADGLQTKVPLNSTTTISFATAEEGAALLGSADGWARDLSPFDRSAHSRQLEDPGLDAFLEFSAAQVQDWTPELLDRLHNAVTSAAERIEKLGLQLDLPSTVIVIRSNGVEMSTAAYTRENAIILPDNMLGMPDAGLEQLFIHELFHVMIRHAPELREPLYGIIGYYPCPNVPVPDELLPIKMTNPDAYRYDFCIDVTAGGNPETVVPMLYAKGPYTGGVFFEYLVFKLMAVEDSQGKWQAARNGGALKLFSPGEVTGFFEKIGTNTQYIIHPEETMANNFVYAVTERSDLPNPEITARVLEVLGGKGARQ